MDAWCHWREGLRSFSVDRIHPVEVLANPARDMDAQVLDNHFTGTYGIFAGLARETAHLIFSPRVANWVADEQWHAQQEGQTLPDGAYELRIPYGDSTELLMEILKYGPDVEVKGPESLRQKVKERLEAALEKYGE